MCVIFVVENARPSPQMVYKAWQRNDHGGGVAWREDGKVYWKKGLKLAEMHEACQQLPMPYVAHFRIASQGGVRPDLCHPFEISRSPSIALEGTTEDRVLFHNGDWDKWQDWALSTAYRTGEPIPAGKWSDSRAIAWIGSIYGPGFFEFLPEKLAIMGPNSLEVFGRGWKDIEGILCSNDFFLNHPQNQGFGYWQGGRWRNVCVNESCAEDAMPGSNYCKDHRVTDLFNCTEKGCNNLTTRQFLFCHVHRDKEGNQGDTCSRSPLELELMGQLANSPALTIQRAEREEKAGKLSKNGLKRIRREYEKILSEMV